MTPRDAVTDYATTRPQAVRREYLEAVHGLREPPVQDLAEYHDRFWWADDILAHPSCVLTATGNELCLMMSKAQPSLPMPEDLTTHLRTG